MKMDEIKELSLGDLKNSLEDAQEELANLHFQHSTHQLDNPLRIRSVRRDIARLKTVIHEFETGIRK